MTLRIGSKRGFTLVELTIVVFIMATMMAVAVPYFANYYNAAKLNSAARSFVTACQLARLQAVTRQGEAVLHLDLDRQQFWVTEGRRRDNPTGSDAVVKHVDIPVNIRLTTATVGDEREISEGQTAIRFYPNGTCDPAAVLFRGVEKTALISVTLDPVTSKGTAVAGKG